MQISHVFLNCLEQEKPGKALEDGCVGNVVHMKKYTWGIDTTVEMEQPNKVEMVWFHYFPLQITVSFAVVVARGSEGMIIIINTSSGISEVSGAN